MKNLSAQEASTYLGITMSGLRKARQRGEITGEKRNRDYEYTLAELEAYVPAKGARGGKLGRPRKGQEKHETKKA